MYGYGFPPPYYPPPMYGPPQYGPTSPVTPTPSDLERGYKLALKIRSKEERKKEKEKEAEGKKKTDERKKIEDSKRRTLFGLEWYILGILSYPFIGPLYYIATNHLKVFGGH